MYTEDDVTKTSLVIDSRCPPHAWCIMVLSS